MDYVRLGTTGLKVSRICLGCMTYGSSKWRPWVLDEEASRPLLRRALELGVNFFDTADMYSDGASEEVVGRARPRAVGGQRPEPGRGGGRDRRHRTLFGRVVSGRRSGFVPIA